MSVQAPDFGRVAVLMGGWAAEREVSLVSGRAVLQGLRARGVEAHPVDMGRDIQQVLKDGAYDRVFNVVHGRGGEDGQLQGLLEIMGLPYTGSGVLGSALAMDKFRTKRVWRGEGMRTPDFCLIRDEADLRRAAALGFPLMVKAALEGSSIGVYRVVDEDGLREAWKGARACDSHVMAEQYIQGQEFTASILGDECLPLIRLETPHAFYDYAAKYQDEDTRYLVPCGLPETQEADLQRLALEAFSAVGASGWGRVDFMLDDAGRAWLIEVNTVPGMTDHSLVPMAAAARGMDFPALVWRILEQTLEDRHGQARA
jgi:D-alanine-D-alanine ligase